MTTEEVLEEAAKAAPNVKQLSPLPLRSKKARMLEYLARTCIDLPKQHADRVAYMQAILELTKPLLKDIFFRSRLTHTPVQFEDFAQDAGEKVIGLVDKYYDPHRGTFASFVVMAGRQVAFKTLSMHDEQGRHSASYHDGLGFDDMDGWHTPENTIAIKHDPVYDTATGSSQLLLLIREFNRRYRTRPGFDPKVARVLQMLSIGPKLVTVPTLGALGELLGVLPSEARKILITALVLFKVYAISCGIENTKELDAWVPGS